jgi:hypothetical protein
MPLILRGVYYTLVSFGRNQGARIQDSGFRSTPRASVREERLTANRRHILALRENYWLLAPGFGFFDPSCGRGDLLNVRTLNPCAV